MMRRREGGFTLIEMIIALALFGLIAVAGLGLVESVLGISARTDGRMDRLAEIQRAMFVIDADLGQLSAGPLAEDRGVLSFRRHAASLDGRGETVAYALAGGTLRRTLGGTAQPVRVQHLLTGVSGIHWGYYVAGEGWRDGWPPDPAKPDVWPAAVAADITLADDAGPLHGTLRRVVELPARP